MTFPSHGFIVNVQWKMSIIGMEKIY